MPRTKRRERAAPRRARAASAEKRARLLDATEDIILRDGYAAVSSRTVAAGVGIQAPLVHYYFPTIDEQYGSPVLGGGDHLVMFDDRPEVRAVMQYLATPEGSQAWIETGTFVSPNVNVPEDWYQVFPASGLADILRDATALRFDADFGLNFVAIIHGVIILVIAEVFRAGTRLAEDQSLTI